jgi:hypothetical protein
MGNAMLSPAQTISHGEDFDDCNASDGAELLATDFSLELSIGLFDVLLSEVKVSQKYSNRVDY